MSTASEPPAAINPDFGPFLEQLGAAVKDGADVWEKAAAEGLTRHRSDADDRFVTPGGRELARFAPHGTLILWDPRFKEHRRLATFDVGGRLLSWFRWGSPDGEAGILKRLGLVLAGNVSIGIVAGVEEHSIWGECDAVALLGEHNAPIRTLCRAAKSDFRNLRFIPPLDEPAAVPPGGGSALMNVFAELMSDQGVTEACYRGPYPTEALLETLLESFEPVLIEGGPAPASPALADFARMFMQGVEEKSLRGELTDSPFAFRPKPHERRLLGDDAALQIRDGQVERFVCGGVSYSTPTVSGFVRQGSRVLHDGSDGWLRASLVILGEPVEHHYLVSVDGLKYAVNDREVPPIDPEPASELWPKAMQVLLAHHSSRLIVPAALEILNSVTFAWGSTGQAPATLRGQEIFLHPAFRFVFRAKRDQAPSEEAKAYLAKALVTEVFLAVAPLVRARAQRALERLSPIEQRDYVRYAMEEFDPQGFVSTRGRDVAELVAALVAG